jgi:hypothetical protein
MNRRRLFEILGICVTMLIWNQLVAELGFNSLAIITASTIQLLRVPVRTICDYLPTMRRQSDGSKKASDLVRPNQPRSVAR